MSRSLARQSRQQESTQFFNLDNGSGTTVDEPVLIAPADKAIRLIRVYAQYGEATQTVAAGNFKVGSSAGGAQYVAATAYENTKSVGDATTASLVLDVVPPGGSVFVRHTGVAVTQTGTARIVVEFAVNE